MEDKQAYPVPDGPDESGYPGLTRFELFAAMFEAGMLGNSHIPGFLRDQHQTIEEYAVERAHALIQKLDEELQ
jgi:hypothetical protein